MLRFSLLHPHPETLHKWYCVLLMKLYRGRLCLVSPISDIHFAIQSKDSAHPLYSKNFFPLKQWASCGEAFRDHENILILLKKFPWIYYPLMILTQTIFTIMITKWWFLIYQSAFCYKEELSLQTSVYLPIYLIPTYRLL